MSEDLRIKLSRMLTQGYTFFKCKANGTVFGVERTPKELDRQRGTEFKTNAKISIITPLYNTPDKYLREMIESVIAQTYGNWELVLADFSDAAGSEVKTIAEEYMAECDRIIFRSGCENKGISENTNTCIGMATGDFIGILDHDDVLHPSALYEVMKAIDEGADFVYTDEIKFEENKDRSFQPAFKPDFGREELKVRNYICHFNVYKKSLLDEAGGGYDPDFDGSQDHEIVLRLTEKAKKIVHIPEILYFWRIHAASVAGNIGAKPYALEAGVRAVKAAYEREGYPGVRFDDSYKVPNYDPLPVDPQAAEVKVITLDDGVPGVEELLKETSEDYLLLISRDLKITTPDHIGQMLVYAMQKGVAAVDAMITDGRGRIISAGLYVREDGSFGARGMGRKADFPGYESDFTHARNVSASSGICTLISRSDFGKPGSRMVWTPHVSATGNKDKIMKAVRGRIMVIDGIGDRDPYYNPNILKFRLEKDNVI